MTNSHLIAPFVRRFLIEEVIVNRGLSPNTQKSYRDTLQLLFRFLAERRATEPTQVTVEQVDDGLVLDFLRDLVERRGSSTATRNQRLAALHSLFRFIARLVPELVEHAARIQDIPYRRVPSQPPDYLEKAEIDALLAVPDLHTAQGRRDHALLLFLYNTGARASEAANTPISALSLTGSLSVRLLGKGRKHRLCPLWPATAETLRNLLGERLDGPADVPVFLNVRGGPITRYGIHTLVERTVRKAVQAVPSLQNKRVSPHALRHTTAVHLLRSGVDINTIRAWLGHVSLETTNRYAQVDLEMKARALNSCAAKLPGSETGATPSWNRDGDLLAFLTSL